MDMQRMFELLHRPLVFLLDICSPFQLRKLCEVDKFGIFVEYHCKNWGYRKFHKLR